MASRGVNKAIIVGNLGKDPEVRYMPNGGAVANFTVATSDSWKDKQTGEQKEQTEWHRIVMYGRLAEVAGEYLRKGSKVYLEGSIQTRKWQNQQGQDVYTTEIKANEMQMLDSRGQGGQGGGMGQGAPMGGGQSMGGGMGQQAPAAQPSQGGFGGGQQQSQQGGFGGGQQQPPQQGGFGGGQQQQAQPQQGGFGGGQQQQQPQQGGFGGGQQQQPQQGGFGGGQQQGGGFAKPQQQPQQQGGGFAKPQGQQQAPAEPPIDFDDDIPF